MCRFEQLTRKSKSSPVAECSKHATLYIGVQIERARSSARQCMYHIAIFLAMSQNSFSAFRVFFWTRGLEEFEI